MKAQEQIVAQAAGVPYVAVPPVGGRRPGAPVVVAWHLQDPPRTESAFAAAVPLAGLDAWRIYLGLPMSGSRLPDGGWDEVTRLATQDAVLNMHRPVIYGAAKEFGAAWTELDRQLALDPGPIGVMGGSTGAAVAQLVLAESDLDIAAAVLISPLVRLRQAVEAMARRFGFSYPWSEASNSIADRLDFVARSDELSRHDRLSVLCIVGEQDDPAGFRTPAAELQAALRTHHDSELVTIPNMAHALADEPGTAPAPQTPHAAAVDHQAVQWFQRYLIGTPDDRHT